MSDKEKFIADLYPSAVLIAKETGMSWELILAQAAQESDWGQHQLAGTNNIFNIKADSSWKGQSRVFNVWEVVDGKKVWLDQPFRVYGSVEEAFRDRIDFLKQNPRYTQAGLFDADVKGNLEKEAQALHIAGYATDPNYAQGLIAVFNGPTMQRAIRLAHEQVSKDQYDASVTNTRNAGIFNPSHPDHSLYVAICNQLPVHIDPRMAAHVTLQAKQNGICSVDQLYNVTVSNGYAVVSGTMPGFRARVDLSEPAPSLEALNEKINTSMLNHNQRYPSGAPEIEIQR